MPHSANIKSIAQDIANSRENLIAIAVKKFRLTQEEAEDLAHDTMAHAITKSHYFDPSKGKIVSWMTTMMYRKFVDLHRKSKKLKKVEGDVIEYEFLLGHEEAIDSFEKELDFDDVKKQFHILSERERTILEYRLEGYKFNEIEKMMGVSASTLRPTAHRAKLKLREYFSQAA
jgi:RNA polymerase sigma factor (sigma-70 family)